MNFESAKVELIVLSILFGGVTLIPLYIAEYIAIYNIYNLTLINNDSLVIAYNFMQWLIIATTYYLFSKKDY